jgi:hypothetical protein
VRQVIEVRMPGDSANVRPAYTRREIRLAHSGASDDAVVGVDLNGCLARLRPRHEVLLLGRLLLLDGLLSGESVQLPLDCRVKLQLLGTNEMEGAELACVLVIDPAAGDE